VVRDEHRVLLVLLHGRGSHFTSLGAFDAHHSGDHATGRYCADPDELPALRVASSMRA
jgi:hypothetical protein